MIIKNCEKSLVAIDSEDSLANHKRQFEHKYIKRIEKKDKTIN